MMHHGESVLPVASPHQQVQVCSNVRAVIAMKLLHQDEWLSGLADAGLATAASLCMWPCHLQFSQAS